MLASGLLVFMVCCFVVGLFVLIVCFGFVSCLIVLYTYLFCFIAICVWVDVWSSLLFYSLIVCCFVSVQLLLYLRCLMCL